MSYSATNDLQTDEIYLAGQRVQPGIYRELHTQREIRLEHEDYLPATFDGRIACYVAVQHTWGNRNSEFHC
jgi:hypothetical protein